MDLGPQIRRHHRLEPRTLVRVADDQQARAAVAAALANSISVKIGYGYRYRNQPPVGFKNWDSTFASGIQISY